MATLTPNQDAEVTITTPGVLKSILDTFATPIAGNNVTTHVVPAGKKWNLKGTSFISSSLVATKTQEEVRLNLNNLYVLHVEVTATTKTTQKFGDQNLTLVAGDEVVITSTLSAYTSGTITHLMLYQEFDA